MKIDLHCHSFYSKDNFSPIEKILKTAKEKGLDGIALTDHDTIAGWEEAKRLAEKLKIFLILGQEIKTKKGDILGLFLKKEIKVKDPIEVIKEIKVQNGVVIIPHPFHYFHRFRENLEKFKDLIDGVEVFNARMFFSFGDKKAFEFAKKYNLAMVAGSDAHFWKDVGSAYTVAQAKDLGEFKEAILSKKTKVEGKKSPIFSLLFPAIGKIKRLWV